MSPSTTSERAEDGRDLATVLGPYVPRTLAEWDDATGVRIAEGTLVSADISGFTALAERLAGLGREGSEELTRVLNERLTQMIAWVHAEGGDVLKFGGDALLCLFEGEGHADSAVRASIGMRGTLTEPVRSEFGGTIQLSVSTGIDTGPQHLFLIDAGGHDELLVCGPGPTATVQAESASSGGNILVSPATAQQLTIAHEAHTVEEWVAVEVPAPPTVEVADPRTVSAVRDRLVPLSHQARLRDVGAGIGEHRRAVVVFIEVTGVDELLVEHSAEEVHDTLQRYSGELGSACDEHGVILIGTDVTKGGWKFILAAGAMGGNAEDHATGALLTALAATTIVPTLPLQVRVGVNAGPIFLGDLGAPSRRTLTVMGDAVNLAARLMGRAAHGEVVAHDGVVEAATFRVDHEPIEPFLVKGKTLPIEASVVRGIGTEPVRRAHDASTVDGRGAELATLRSAWRLSQDGAIAVSLEGAPGMGKTQLLTSFLEPLDTTVHRGIGHPRRAGRPYAAIASALRSALGLPADDDAALTALQTAANDALGERADLLPLLGPVLDLDIPSTSQSTAVRAEFVLDQVGLLVLDLLDATGRDGLLLLVEDAHHADAATRALLALLAARLGSRPALLVVTTDLPLQEFAQFERVLLGPLSDDVIRRIVIAEAPVALSDPQVDEIVRRAQGNPLFATELATASGEGDELPMTIEDAMRRRLDVLPHGTRLALQEAAVVGVGGPIGLAEAVSPAFRELDWSAVSGLLERDEEDAFRFTHSLIRDAAYNALAYRRRRELHGELAETMEAFGAPADALSLHYAQARRPEGWKWSVLAAEFAETRHSARDAAVLYGRAVEVAARLDGLEPTEVARVTELWGDACEIIADFDGAREAFELARDRFAGELVADVRLLCKLGMLGERQARYEEAIAHLTEALERLDDEAGAAKMVLSVEAHLRLAGVRYRLGEYQPAIEHARQAVVGARHGADPKSIAHAYMLLDNAAADEDGIEDFAARAAELFRRIGDRLYEAHALNNMGVNEYFQGRWDASVELYVAAAERYRQVGDVRSAALVDNNLGEVLSDQGRLADAAEPLAAALRGAEATGYELGRVVALGNVGRLHTRAGRHEEALAVLGEALDELRGIGARYYEQVTLLRIAEAYAEMGKLDDARDQMAEVDGDGADPTLIIAADRLRVFLAHPEHQDREETCRRLREVAARAAEAGATFDECLTLLTLQELGEDVDGEPPADRLGRLGVTPSVRPAGLNLLLPPRSRA